MIKTDNNKLGAYIQKLMTTVIDKEQDEFVKNLAISELSRLSTNINEFIIKNEKPVEEEYKEKELLQEEKKDGKQSSK